MKKKEVNKTLAYKGKIIWTFIKYQLCTKSIVYFLIFPVYKYLINLFIRSSGQLAITSGDYKNFIFSYGGMGVFVLSVFMMSFMIGIDINSFIIMSALIVEKKIEMSLSKIFIICIKSLKSFLSFKGLLIMGYIAVIFPIIGIGINISLMENFKIPNFITYVIDGNLLYSIIYWLLILVLLIIGYYYIFGFHYVIICDDNIKEAFKKSGQLMRKYWFDFFKGFILKGLMYASVIILLVLGGVAVAVFVNYYLLNENRVFLLFNILTIGEFALLIGLLTMPLTILLITRLFYEFNSGLNIKITYRENIDALSWEENKIHKLKTGTKLKLLVLITAVLLINFCGSLLFARNFDEFFKQHNDIEIIAHRAGGDLQAENSLEGVIEAIKNNVDWTEIDVQRTKDGYYIINHDSSFARLTGVNKKAYEMTLEEIKQLKVINEFDKSKPPVSVATLDEIIEASKDKIGLFIELKGETADYKMVDDIIKKVSDYNIKDYVLLSLDYSIIKYIEDKYPDVVSGYLYFFSLGNTTTLVSDYIIIEESLATIDNIDMLQYYGKKVVVWTVNSEESIERYANSAVDGIITDYVLQVKDALKYRHEKSDLQLILDKLFNY